MKKQQKPPGKAAKFVAGFILVFVAVYALTVSVNRALKSSDYFRIREVITNDRLAHDFSYLVGRNIFELNLQREARFIAASFPTYKKIRLIRIFPDQLFVDFVKRKPLACVKLGRYWYVDEESVFWGGEDRPLTPALPVITGLEGRIAVYQQGRRYSDAALQASLSLLKEIRANRAFSGYTVSRVSPRDNNTLSFFVVPYTRQPAAGAPGDPEGVEIKINREGLKEKLYILAQMLAQLKSRSANIEYIDLRFKDPVIKFRK